MNCWGSGRISPLLKCKVTLRTADIEALLEVLISAAESDPESRKIKYFIDRLHRPEKK